MLRVCFQCYSVSIFLLTLSGPAAKMRIIHWRWRVGIRAKVNQEHIAMNKQLSIIEVVII